jgi:Fanconi anemia group M protein
VFVGQAKKKNTGLSQKQQKEMLEKFENEKFSCLIATSVGEEGLDIPEVTWLFLRAYPFCDKDCSEKRKNGKAKEGRVIT